MRVGLNNSHGVKEHTFGLASPPNQFLLYTLTDNFARGDFMDEKAIAAILAILRRGNNAVVRKKGGGVVVLEEKKTIKYSAQ